MDSVADIGPFRMKERKRGDWIRNEVRRALSALDDPQHDFVDHGALIALLHGRLTTAHAPEACR